MKRFASALLKLTFLLGFLAACSGGTSGSVRNSGQSCFSGGGSGNCDGHLGSLSGTYGVDIEDEEISTGDRILVEMEVSVDSGSVRVFLESPDGEITSAQVGPGMPAFISGTAKGEFDGFQIGFEAQGDSVEGITYSLSYAVQ